MTLPTTEYRSTRLLVVTRYFLLTGSVGLVVLSGVLAAGAMGNVTVRLALSHNPWAPIVGAIQCVSNLLVGQALWRRKRSAAVVAVLTFAAPLALVAFGRGASMPSLVVSVLGLAATASIWPELGERT